MRVLLDEQLPVAPARSFVGHDVDTVSGRVWAGVKNGELLRRMRGEYEVLVTMDRSLEFQQDDSVLPYGVLLVRANSNRLDDLVTLLPSIQDALPLIEPGRVLTIGT